MSRIDTFVDGAVLSPSPSRPGAITVQPGWSRNARADRERSGRLRLWRADSMTCAGRRGLRSFTFSSESINGGRTRTRSRSLSVVSRSGCRLSGRRIGGVRCRLTGSCGWSRCRTAAIEVLPGWEWQPDPANAVWRQQHTQITAWLATHGPNPSDKSVDPHERRASRWLRQQQATHQTGGLTVGKPGRGHAAPGVVDDLGLVNDHPA